MARQRRIARWERQNSRFFHRERRDTYSLRPSSRQRRAAFPNQWEYQGKDRRLRIQWLREELELLLQSLAATMDRCNRLASLSIVAQETHAINTYRGTRSQEVFRRVAAEGTNLPSCELRGRRLESLLDPFLGPPLHISKCKQFDAQPSVATTYLESPGFGGTSGHPAHDPIQVDGEWKGDAVPRVRHRWIRVHRLNNAISSG